MTAVIAWAALITVALGCAAYICWALRPAVTWLRLAGRVRRAILATLERIDPDEGKHSPRATMTPAPREAASAGQARTPTQPNPKTPAAPAPSTQPAAAPPPPMARPVAPSLTDPGEGATPGRDIRGAHPYLAEISPEARRGTIPMPRASLTADDESRAAVMLHAARSRTWDRRPDTMRRALAGLRKL